MTHSIVISFEIKVQKGQSLQIPLLSPQDVNNNKVQVILKRPLEVLFKWIFVVRNQTTKIT